MSQKVSSKRALPIIRLFASSTFSDLKHERNALAAQVWPELERYCQQRGFTFQAIDLRWGVPAEAGLDHRTMRICFEELRRSQETSPEPNFLILLGNRYGWRPLPEVISVAEFERLKTAAEQIQSEPPDPARKPTDSQVALLKQAVAVLEDWYLLDENAKPFGEQTSLGEYVLRTRKTLLHDVDYGKYVDADGKLQDTPAWNYVQFVLWSIVNRAFPAAGLGDRFAPNKKGHAPSIVRFQASATEQEIWHGALQVDPQHVKEHVIAWFREIENLNDYPPGPQFKDFVDLKEDGTPDQGSKQALEQLKSELKGKLDAENTFESKCRWSVQQQGPSVPDVTTDHLDAMCEQIRKRLQAMIILQINAYWGCDLSADDATLAQVRGSQQELDHECADHLRFAGERAPEKTFVGRRTELRRIREYVRSKTNHPFVVHGPSGSGKTALLGKIIQEVTPPRSADGTRAKTGPIVLTRFIGMTPESSNLRSLLSSLCRELRQDFEMPSPLPTDLNELIDEFYSQLGKATAARPVFVFLDALDQLDAADRGRSVYWIRSLLPSMADASCHARLVVSCLSPSDEFPEDSEACEPFRELKLRTLLSNHELGALDENDARQLFGRWLHNAGHSVSKTQQDMIWSALQKSSACRQPLFLKVLFEEARQWRSFDAPSAIPESLAQLLDELFIRLGKPTEHGELIGIALSCLVSARYGLSEGELLEILFTDPKYKALLAEDNKRNGHELPPDSNRIPIAPWTRLRSDLAPYLSERSAPGSAVVHFYHRQVERAVRTRYLNDPELQTCRHRQLADYFETQDYWLEPLEKQRERARTLPPTPRPANARKVDELPWQRLQAQQGEELTALLTNLAFLEAKTEAGQVFDLAADFAGAVQLVPADRPWQRLLRLLEEAIRRDIHFVARHPTTLFQCLWNSCWWYDCPEAAQHYVARDGGGSAEVLPWSRPEPKLSTLLEVWRSAKERETAGFAWLRSLRPPAVPLNTALRAVLRGHGAGIKTVAFSPDGRRILSACLDKTARIWNLDNGKELLCIRDQDRVRSAVFSPDGQRIITAADSIRILDATTGELVKQIGWSAKALAHSADGQKLAAGTDDNAVRVWDAHTFQELACFTGHEGLVTSVAFSPDGRRIVSGSYDNSVRIWNMDTCQALACLSKHSDWVNCVAYAPGGKQIVSTSKDLTVRIWHADAAREQICFRGHQSEVRGAAFSPDGRQLASVAGDCTLRIWDVATSKELVCLRGHEGGVNCVAFSPDGKNVITGASDQTVCVWSADRGEAPRALHKHQAPINCFAFSPDGCLLATGSLDKTVRFWDAQNGRPLARLLTHEAGVDELAFSPDGRKLASGAWDRSVRIWEVGSGRLLLVLSGHNESNNHSIRRITFSPNGRRLAVWSESDIFMWNPDTGKLLTKLPLEDELAGDIIFSPDSRRIVQLSNQRLHLWEVDSGQLLQVFPERKPRSKEREERAKYYAEQVYMHYLSGEKTAPTHLDRSFDDEIKVRCAAFSPDGRRMVTGGPDGCVRAWELANAKERLCLRGHGNGVFRVAYSADGMRIYSVSEDNIVNAWDAESGIAYGGTSAGAVTSDFVAEARPMLRTAFWRNSEDANDQEIAIVDVSASSETIVWLRSLRGFASNPRFPVYGAFTGEHAYMFKLERIAPEP